MNTWIRASLVGLAVGGMTLPLVGGVAMAAEDEGGLPDTQSPLQGVDAGQATLQTAVASLLDAGNGENRADGVNGLESEFYQFDPRDVAGPLGGLLDSGGPFA